MVVFPRPPFGPKIITVFCCARGRGCTTARLGTTRAPSWEAHLPCARGNSGKTGGGRSVFASMTRLPLIPWEDGSPRRPGRPLPDGSEGACRPVAGHGGVPGSERGGQAARDRAVEASEEPPSAEAEWEGEGQRAEAA